MGGSSLRKRIELMPDEALAAMLGPERETYMPEAIAIAEDVARKRELDVEATNAADAPSSQPEENPSEDKRVGAGGWLGLLTSIFVFSGGFMLIVIPLLLLTGDAAGFETFLMVVALLVSGLSFRAGLLLWNSKPRAPEAAIVALRASQVATGLAFSVTIITLGTGTIVGASVEAFMGLAVPEMWIAYLRRSRRVANTFPEFQQSRLT